MKGFTLVELLVSIALIGILATIGIVSLSNFSFRQEVDNTINGMAVLLRNAQNRSISQEDGQVWGVYFDNPIGSTPTYSLFFGATVPPPAGNIVAKYSVSNKLNFKFPSLGSSYAARFGAVTGLPLETSQIYLRDVAESSTLQTVYIEANGRITTVVGE